MIRNMNCLLTAHAVALVFALSVQTALAQSEDDHEDGFHRVSYSGPSQSSFLQPALQPAFVTTQEAGLDAIFSQASFGANAIDIRFEPFLTLISPNLQSIDTPAEINALLNSSQVSSPGVNLYFVDAIDECGGFDTGIVGCAFQSGNDLAVESAAAAGAIGVELIAHELGHALGLRHTSTANLLSGRINFNTTLSTNVFELNNNGMPFATPTDQIARILSSPLIQTDLSGQRFIQITPILVVPEPAALAMLLPGIALCILNRRNRVKR